MMKIYTNGIYFKQVDQKEVGYYIKDQQGNFIHQKYVKPTFWQRAKYFARYGDEMNLETRATSYLLFLPYSDELIMGATSGDAITAAKNLKNRKGYYPAYKYVLEEKTINFKTPESFYILEFQNDGLQFKLQAEGKSNNLNLKDEIYMFLNWDNL